MSDELTPVQRFGPVLVKRDDLFEANGARGGKARACLLLARAATRGLVTAGSRRSPQVAIVAAQAKALGLPCRAHTPTGEYGPELQKAALLGAEIVQHRPGYNGVIKARAAADARERGWTLIPFGMEDQVAVSATSAQVASLTRADCAGMRRVVVAVGSGMTLVGILKGLSYYGLANDVLGVCVGADPRKRLDYWWPAWRFAANLVDAGIDYHRAAPVTNLAGLELDPIYEAKAIPFLQPDDLLWVVGHRDMDILSTEPRAASRASV